MLRWNNFPTQFIVTDIPEQSSAFISYVYLTIEKHTRI